MPLISDPGNTRSRFPNAIDAFTSYQDGTGEESILNAEIWNKIMTAILRIEEHASGGINVLNGDRRLLTLSGSVTVPSATGAYETDLTLTSSQSEFLRSRPLSPDAMILASVWIASGGSGAYRAYVQPVLPDKVRLRIDALDTSANVPSGTYQVRITFLV